MGPIVLRAPVLLLVAFNVTVQAADRVVVDGSTGVTPLVAALAKEYQAQKPGSTIEIGKGLGTRARIQALAEGRIDIAMASHGLNIADIQRQGMVVHEIAKIAVVFGVNSDVPVSSLNEDQICAMYAGRTKSWKEVGGPDLAVVAVTRPDSEVDTEVVRERIGCLTKLEMPEAVKVAPKAGEMAQALASTSGAIGMTTMTVVEQSQGRVKAVSLKGVAPTAENVQARRYTLTRDSFLVVRSDASPAATRFIEFVRSPAGAKVIAANGAIPSVRD